MQKERVLVCDSEGIFLKMFKRRFKEEFDFTEKSLIGEVAVNEFDRVIYIINNHKDLIYFLGLETKYNVLVCLFNIQLYRSLSFLEVTNNLILIDESKTRAEILKELNTFFSSKLDSIINFDDKTFRKTKMSNKKFQEYYKAMYYLM